MSFEVFEPQQLLFIRVLARLHLMSVAVGMPHELGILTRARSGGNIFPQTFDRCTLDSTWQLVLNRCLANLAAGQLKENWRRNFSKSLIRFNLRRGVLIPENDSQLTEKASATEKGYFIQQVISTSLPLKTKW